MLPLDLHVLSLPLAFILSQDQTLHCKRFDLTINLIKINVGYNLLLRLYLTISRYIGTIVLLLSIFSKILPPPLRFRRRIENDCDANGLEPFCSLVTAYIFYYLKNCFVTLFIWGCKSKSRFISLQNFIAKILNYFV